MFSFYVISKEKSPQVAPHRNFNLCRATCGDLLRLFAVARVSFLEMTNCPYNIVK